MTWRAVPDRATPELADVRSLAAVDRLPDELLSPMLSGAYVRGIAETFNLFGMPAIFFDRDGRVLFANTPAFEAMGPGLQLRAQHLVADHPEDNTALARLLADALHPTESCHSFRSVDLRGSSVTLHAMPMPDQLATSGQLLRVILVVDGHREPAVTDLIARIVAVSASSAKR